MAHAGGRPTKYNPKIIEKSKKYIESCVDNTKRVLESENSTTGRLRFLEKLVVKLPKVEGLCLCLKISRSTAYEWAATYKEFSDILEQINQIQANRVIDETLAGNYNPMIAKLLLAKHGYKEEKDITSGGQPIGKLLDELE